MRIGVNGFFWHMDTTGSGQYLHHLLIAVGEIAPPGEHLLVLPRRTALSGPEPGRPWTIRAVPTPFDRLHEHLAKLWFEQAAFPMACRRAAIDVAHVPYFAPPLCSAVPTVVTIHDLIPLILPEYRGSTLARGYARLVSRAAPRASLVITDSRASARDIERLLGIPPERIQVIYLAADESYRPLTPDERRPTLERLQVSYPYLLYLGGFDVRKNVTGLLRAFAQARARLKGVKLVIAGKLPTVDTDFSPDPRKMARRLGVEDAVHYTGWVADEDKPALYAGAVAFVFPSCYEGFGLPVLESISCGTPAIVGQGSALEEVLGPGGLVVHPPDINALANAMVDLVRKPHLRGLLSRKGLQHASDFSWQKTARETLDAYRLAIALWQRRR